MTDANRPVIAIAVGDPGWNWSGLSLKAAVSKMVRDLLRSSYVGDFRQFWNSQAQLVAFHGNLLCMRRHRIYRGGIFSKRTTALAVIARDQFNLEPRFDRLHITQQRMVDLLSTLRRGNFPPQWLADVEAVVALSAHGKPQ
jgi:hypothetical protein